MICELTLLVCIRPANGPLPKTANATIVTFADRKARKDPYALAQSKQRKAANLARQRELKKERDIPLGDPVRGINTPFLESLDTVGESTSQPRTASDSSTGAVQQDAQNAALLNHFISPDELAEAMEHSFKLTQPVPAASRDIVDPVQEAAAQKQHAEAHARATEAIARIVKLSNSSSKSKTRANIQRCIETFGRHNTDKTLQSRPPINPIMLEGKPPLPEKTPRAGRDTGSSEVQIAILTAKIRVLAKELEKKGAQKDKLNKKNLRSLVHRRQKLLKYMVRKERGGERWQHLVQTLGLTEGTYKGELSL